MHELLLGAFNKERICPERFNNFDRFSDEELESYDYFSAHMDFFNLQRVARPAYTITVLRDPRERILSLYYYWRAQTDAHIEKHNLIGPRLAKQMSLVEFLNWREDGIASNLDNYYVRYLLGVAVTGKDGRLVLRDGEAVRVAMRNLLTIDEVGFIDALPDLAARVGKRLGLELPQELPQARSSENFGKDPNTEPVEREPITPEIEARLDELVRLDRVLYESARLMFAPPRSAVESREEAI